MAPQPIAPGGADASPVLEKRAKDVIYLSNDDAMSVASAQRVLWAVQHNKPVRASEIRPHEFLNYFTFDTVDAADHDTFGVQGAARQLDPDTLSVAVTIHGVRPPRPNLDLTLVLDRSGSMKQEGRMSYLKRGLHQMVDQLQPGDRVNMVVFDDKVEVTLEDFVVARDSSARLEAAINELSPRGSTDLNAGLQKGYELARRHTDAGRERRVMLITDAQLNTGVVDPNIVTKVGEAFEESGIRLTAVGVGSDFNDKVLNQLTEEGHGAYVYIGSEAVVDRFFGKGFQSMVHTIAEDVRFSLELPASLVMERFYGEEASTDATDVQTVDFQAGNTQLFLHDLKIAPTGLRTSEALRLVMRWRDPTTGSAEEQVWTSTIGELLESRPNNLYKARALMAWTDMLLQDKMGGDACEKALPIWQQRKALVKEDAEIRWISGIYAPDCRPQEVIAEAQ